MEQIILLPDIFWTNNLILWNAEQRFEIQSRVLVSYIVYTNYIISSLCSYNAIKSASTSFTGLCSHLINNNRSIHFSTIWAMKYSAISLMIWMALELWHNWNRQLLWILNRVLLTITFRKMIEMQLMIHSWED